MRMQAVLGSGQGLPESQELLPDALPLGEGRPGQEHGKLVAADAEHIVAAAEGLQEVPGGPADNGISGGVAAGVVDVLEVVDIAQQQGEGGILLLAEGQAFFEGAVVEKAGELVVLGLVEDELMGLLILRKDPVIGLGQGAQLGGTAHRKGGIVGDAVAEAAQRVHDHSDAQLAAARLLVFDGNYQRTKAEIAQNVRACTDDLLETARRAEALGGQAHGVELLGHQRLGFR